MNLLNTLLDNIVSRVTAIGLAAIAAALLTYFRTEASAGIRWLLGPLIRFLPWHHQVPDYRTDLRQQTLRSELTVADLFLVTADGRTAIYRKTGDYTVGSGHLSFYREGVTVAGHATDFSTEFGAISKTEAEHGFHVSTIEFSSAIRSGANFRNVFRAKLVDSFTSQDEHWTQEIAISTQRLLLRVHFPVERPPISIRCEKLLGLMGSKIMTGAQIARLSGQPSIVWEIEQPALGDVYKLQWRW